MLLDDDPGLSTLFENGLIHSHTPYPEKLTTNKEMVNEAL